MKYIGREEDAYRHRARLSAMHKVMENARKQVENKWKEGRKLTLRDYAEHLPV
jgi:hypothetical protein